MQEEADDADVDYGLQLTVPVGWWPDEDPTGNVSPAVRRKNNDKGLLSRQWTISVFYVIVIVKLHVTYLQNTEKKNQMINLTYTDF